MRNVLSLIFGLISFAMCAQKEFAECIENIPMRSIGPASTSGRVTAIAVDERHSGAIYIGAASGGVWKSKSGGVTWEPIFDDQRILGIGSIALDPVNSNYVWVGTGEGNPRNSHTSGGGIFLSQDAGKSWQDMGLHDTKTIHRIAVDPSNHSVVYAGAMGNIWSPNAERGVYRSIDMGKSWQKILFLNDTVGCADLVMDPIHPQKLFAAMYHFQRKPYHYQSGGKQSGLYMTNDGGDHWIELKKDHGLPEGPFGRIGLAIAPSNSDVVYALIECANTGLYRSIDGGSNWSLITNEHINDRPFYYHEIYVNPTNEHHLMYLHSTISESFDGGKTWSTVLPYWGVHPDHHAFWWSRTNPKHMMEGNDGGFNQSYDGGRNWSFAANLPLGQFYHINYDMDKPYHIYGGLQDNGSWRGISRHFNEGGIRDSDWQEILFGDGFDVVPHPTLGHLNYAMWQGGNLVEFNHLTNEERYIQPSAPQGTTLRFNWNAAIDIDPTNGHLYLGSQFVHLSTDRGASWQIISPDLTTNDSVKICQSAITGGLTPDRTSAEMYCTILAIDVLGNQLLVGTDDGQVHMSLDLGKTWTNLSKSITGLPKTAWITQVHWGQNGSKTIFVVANNYRFNDYGTYLFRSEDGGKSWVNLAANASINGHALSFVEDTKDAHIYFMGTEHGLYCSLDRGITWHHWNRNFPNVAVQDLKIHPREGDLIIGTFGRSVYIMDQMEAIRAMSVANKNWKGKEIAVVPIQNCLDRDYKRPTGQRFPADGTFEGQNLPRGVGIGFFANLIDPPAISNDKKKDASSKTEKAFDRNKELVKICILTLQGDTIRNLTHKPDSGFNLVYWNLDSKGFRWPSLQQPKPDDGEPGGGPRVLPGLYQVKLTWGQWRDSATFVIEGERFGNLTNATYSAVQKELYDQILVQAERANSQLEWYRKTERSIGLANDVLRSTPDSLKRNFTSLNDSLKADLAKWRLFYFLPDDAKGIQNDDDKLGSILWKALVYAESQDVLPGANANNQISQLIQSVERAEGRAQAIEGGVWKAWKEAYQNLQPNIFQDVKKK
jgi:photosystem II stability/assembly factor-like uncharacterized protein